MDKKYFFQLLKLVKLRFTSFSISKMLLPAVIISKIYRAYKISKITFLQILKLVKCRFPLIKFENNFDFALVNLKISKM